MQSPFSAHAQTTDGNLYRAGRTCPAVHQVPPCWAGAAACESLDLQSAASLRSLSCCRGAVAEACRGTHRTAIGQSLLAHLCTVQGQHVDKGSNALSGVRVVFLHPINIAAGLAASCRALRGRALAASRGGCCPAAMPVAVLPAPAFPRVSSAGSAATLRGCSLPSCCRGAGSAASASVLTCGCTCTPGLTVLASSSVSAA